MFYILLILYEDILNILIIEISYILNELILNIMKLEF